MSADKKLQTLDDFVLSTLSDEDMETVLGDYERLSADGMIGECLLRKTASDYINSVPYGCSGGVTTTMLSIALVCFREFAWRYLEPDE